MRSSQKEMLHIFYLSTCNLAFMGITSGSVKSLNIPDHFTVIITVLPANGNT